MTRSDLIHGRAIPASSSIKVLAWVLAVASITFAVVNVGFELTGRFSEGPLSEYASGLSVANWFVTALKVTGGAVALLSVWPQSRITPRLVNVLIWGAAGTLGVYALGNLGQAVGLAADGAGNGSAVDLAGLVYVVGFLLAAAGFVVLAKSHSRRHGLGAGPAVIGVLGGVVILATILLVLPLLLTQLGIMPAT